MRKSMRQSGVAYLVGWAVSVVATVISLYWSAILHLNPCSLCWVERACMYPIAAILTFGLIAHPARKYVSVGSACLSALGLGVAVYHTYLTFHPLQDVQGGFCSMSTPCSTPAFTIWSTVTPSELSALGFLLILCLVLPMYSTNQSQQQAHM